METTIWSPIVCNTNLNKLQVIQNNALRLATGCTKDTNQQHLHEETKVLPINQHLILHASQLRQKSQLPSHPLNDLTKPIVSKRLLKSTIYKNSNYTINFDTEPINTTIETIKDNMTSIHSKIVTDYLDNRDINKIINVRAPEIHKSELTLCRKTRRTLAQLRTGKSPILNTYKDKIDPVNYPSPLCPLCINSEHNTQHLFSCNKIPTTLNPIDLWENPVGVAGVLEAWELRIADLKQ